MVTRELEGRWEWGEGSHCKEGGVDIFVGGCCLSLS